MYVHPHQQKNPVAAPLKQDANLQEFSGRVQGNLFDLWQNAHDHTVSSADRAVYAALTTDAQRIAYLASWLGLS